VRESAAARRTTACCLHPRYARRQHLLPHLQIESLLSLPLDQRGMLCFVVRAPEAQSGLGGARILVCGSSDRRRPPCGRCPRLSYQPICELGLPL